MNKKITKADIINMINVVIPINSDIAKQEYIEDFSCFIEDRLDTISQKIANTEIYQNKYKEYSKLYDNLKNVVSEQELENFENSIHSLNSIENMYLYLQAIADSNIIQ